MKRSLFVVLAVLVVTILAVPAVQAQQFGSLVGTVVDDTKAPMPGVSVTLSGPGLQGTRLVQTDINGGFRFTPIPPGKDFKISCSLEGFQAAVRSGVTVALNSEANAGTIVMKFGDIKEQVVVESKAIVVDTTKSTVDNNVDWGILDTLATNRSFQGVMSMAPGTEVSANPFAPVNNPSVHGGADDDNLYLINGFNQTDPTTLTWGNAINYDTIAEVQLQTAGFEAEFGRTAGGIINLVTKSGGNEVHGSARFVWADRKFQEGPSDYKYCNPTEGEFCTQETLKKRPDITTSEKRPEATLGGFIVKDLLWYFLSYERRGREQDFSRPIPTVCEGETDPAVTQCLDQTVTDKSTYEGNYISGKLTYQIAPSQTLVGYYNTDPIDISDTNQRYYADSFDSSKSSENIQKQGGYLAGLNLTSMFGSSTFSDIKVSYYHAPLDVVPQYPMDSRNYFDLNTYYNFGDAYSTYKSIREDVDVTASVSQYVDDMLGSHTFKGGFEYLAAKSTETQIYNPYGQYYGYGMDYSNPDNPDHLAFWILITDLIDEVHKQDYIGLYFQDKWQVKGLTLNVGVRAEQEKIRNNEGRVIKNFDFGDHIMPRLGFAYDLTNTGFDWLAGSAVRGSWSRFRVFVSGVLGYSFDYFPNGYNYYSYDPVTNELVDQFKLSSNATIDPKGISSPYVDEWTLGYDQKLGRTMSASMVFVSRVSENGILMGYNGLDDDGDAQYMVQNLDIPSSRYQSLELSVKKVMIDDRLQFFASWTRNIKVEGLAAFSSKGSNGAGGGYAGCDSEICTEGWYGRTDTPNTVKFNGSYSQPWGDFGTTTLGVSNYYYSGKVYSDYTVRVVGGSQVTDYLTNTGNRNVGSWNRLDVHLEHQMKFEAAGGLGLSVYGDVFNVLNRQSALSRSGYLGYNVDFTTTPVSPSNPRYGYPSRTQNPRVFQVGVKVEF